MEIENIARHIRMGKTPYRAAIDAADEIGLAVIASTFTIVAGLSCPCRSCRASQASISGSSV